MGKAKFNLRITKSDKLQPIYLKCQIKGKRFSYATELKAFPTKWDFKKQRVKGYSSEAKMINKQLNHLQQLFDNCYFDIKHSDLSLTIDNVKQCFLKKVGGYNDTITISKYSNHLKSQYDKIGKTYYLKSTVDLLNEYQENLTFEDLTLDFYYNFLAFLYDHKKNYKRGYINKIIQRVRQLCKAAIKEEITTNLAFKNFALVEDETTQIYLNEKQISQLFYVSLEDDALEKIKDLFLIACGLGLRFSDWNQIKKSNFKTIDGVTVLSVKTKKDNKALSIPINIFWWTKKLLEKYNYSPPIAHYQQFHLKLSIIAEKAHLIKTVELIEYTKTKTTKQLRICDKVGTHTARRSFVTNAKLKGFTDSQIRKMTGHKTIISFNKYDKQTAVQNAVEIGKKAKLKAIK